jgi:hypothetical protein
MSRTPAFLRLLVVIVLNAPFLACRPAPTSPPPIPTLVNGALLGNRACGNYPVQPGRTLTFTCPPLPTTIQTGWQLTPLLKPPTPKGVQWTNRVVVLTVTTPTTTNINVVYVTENGNILPMRGIPDGPGEPGSVTGPHQFAFAATDDGTTKTWTLKFILDSCTTDAEVRIAASNAAGAGSPLSAILMRHPNELECTSSGGGVFYATTGPRSSTSPGPTSGPCPGGGQPRLFGVCENCSPDRSPSMNRWSGGEYCDEAQVRAVYGYTDPLLNPTPKAQTCTMRFEPNRENCEVP